MSSFHPLVPFELTDSTREFRVGGRVFPTPEAIEFEFELTGPIEDLVIPGAVARPAIVDGLWKATCFEAFLGVRDAESYFELNSSPSGDWAAYEFTRYREGMKPATLKLNSRSRRTASNEFSHRFEISRSSLPAIHEVGLSVVLKHRDGVISFWALRHSGPKPDFHDRNGFLIQV
jgi:hypothetical protein